MLLAGVMMEGIVGYGPNQYEVPTAGQFYSPFDLRLRPMERLLLIDFTGDPVYRCIEVQSFDDAVQGKGLLAMLYRRDDRVDVYRQPGLSIERDGYEIQKGLGEWIESPLEGARLAITPHGAELDLAFDDHSGRRIEARVRETWPRRRPASLLALVSAGVSHPRKLMIVYIFKFDFVRRPGAEVSVRIGGAVRRPVRMPLLLPGTPAYFTRYSAEPFVVEWNSNRSGALTALSPRGAGELRDGDAVYTLSENSGHFEIEKMFGSNGRHSIAITFTPPVPDIICLVAGFERQGKFFITVDDKHSLAAGDYQIRPGTKETEVVLDIARGWKPTEGDLLLRTIYTFVPLFKRWPKTYRWSAKLKHGTGGVTIESAWERK